MKAIVSVTCNGSFSPTFFRRYGKVGEQTVGLSNCKLNIYENAVGKLSHLVPFNYTDIINGRLTLL